MRALKTILIIAIALGVLILVLGLVGSRTYRVERTTEIEASPAVVYGYVSHVGKMREWGPWQELDKDQVQTIEGTDGTVGAILKWEGDTVGRGSQEITVLTQNKYVGSKLTFFVPILGQANSTSTYDLDTTRTGTRITWAIQGENGFLARAMSVFLNLDAQVGSDLERGLAKLSTLATTEHRRQETEREESTFLGYFVDIVERNQQVYVGKRALVPFIAIGDFYARSLRETAATAKQANLQVKGYPSGIYFARDLRSGVADLLAGMPVKADTSLTVDGMQVYSVPASSMAHVAYYGDYAQVRSAHEAITAMVQARGYTQHGISIEEFVTDPGTEPDTTKWLTNVYHLIH